MEAPGPHIADLHTECVVKFVIVVALSLPHGYEDHDCYGVSARMSVFLSLFLLIPWVSLLGHSKSLFRAFRPIASVAGLSSFLSFSLQHSTFPQ